MPQNQSNQFNPGSNQQVGVAICHVTNFRLISLWITNYRVAVLVGGPVVPLLRLLGTARLHPLLLAMTSNSHQWVEHHHHWVVLEEVCPCNLFVNEGEVFMSSSY